MERSNGGVGLLAVCAVSWSVAMLTLKAHKRLLSDFMKKMDSELHGRGTYGSCRVKKVRFAEDVVEPSSDNKEYRNRRSRGRRNKAGGTRDCGSLPNRDSVGLTENRRTQEEEEEEEDQSIPTNGRGCNCADDSSSMPLNRQVLYRGIIEHRMLKGPTNLPRHFY